MAIIDVTTPFVDPDNPGNLITITPNVASDQSFNLTKLLRTLPDKVELYFPAGVYYITDTMFRSAGVNLLGSSKRITLFGDGPGVTTIRLISGTTLANPIFYLQGATSTAKFFAMHDLTLDGNNCTANWLQIDAGYLLRFERMEFINTQGYAILGRQWWDSIVDNVTFSNMGTSSVSVISLECLDLSNKAFTSSNNLKFIDCRWIGCKGVGVYFNYSKVIYFANCTWEQPASQTVGGHHLFLDNAYIVSVVGSRFNGCRSDSIRAYDAYGLMLMMNSFEGAKDSDSGTTLAAVRLDVPSGTSRPSQYCVITGNNFAKGGSPTPVANEWNILPSTYDSTNVIADNRT